jgi:threonine/homoserine/homoserine lactone efflux protein
MMGFVQTLANPGVLVGWVVIGAAFVARGWVEPTWTGKIACLGGVALAVGAWFMGLSWAISLGHKKFTRATLLKMQRGSGIVLIAIATGHGCLIAWELSKLHRQRERERSAPRTEYIENSVGARSSSFAS